MTDKNGEDEDLWDYVKRTIRPLARTGGGEGARGRTFRHDPAMGDRLAPARRVPPPRVTGPSSFQLDARNEKRLRRGEMDIEARIDLHGMRQDAAHRRLESFILDAYDRGARCVLVITGKGVRIENSLRPWYETGRGVLRERVPEWLAQGAVGRVVLRTMPAQQKHGGAGALYVLLRRNISS